jgi:membrane dipeptidase
MSRSPSPRTLTARTRTHSADPGSVDQGRWRADVYPPPPHHYPAGIETPRTLHALTEGLVRRGYDEPGIRKILGVNLLRVYRAVWGE